MALKDGKGRYNRITGIFIQYGKVELRIAKNYDEEERREEPEEAKYYNVIGIDIPDEIADEIKAKMYGLLKKHKTNVQTVKVPAEYDDEGKLKKKATEKTSFDLPYKDMTDC